METYRGFIVDSQSDPELWLVRLGDSVIFKADSYDEALNYIDVTHIAIRERKLQLALN